MHNVTNLKLSNFNKYASSMYEGAIKKNQTSAWIRHSRLFSSCLFKWSVLNLKPPYWRKMINCTFSAAMHHQIRITSRASCNFVPNIEGGYYSMPKMERYLKISMPLLMLEGVNLACCVCFGLTCRQSSFYHLVEKYWKT